MTAVSDGLVNFVAGEEGFSATWYGDGGPRNVGTIGYGFTGNEWTRRTITRIEALALLRRLLSNDYRVPTDRFLKDVGWDVPEAAREALISFAYNLGAFWPTSRGFETMQRAVRAKSVSGVASAFGLYVNPGTAVEAGLRARRRREQQRWLDGWKNAKPDPLSLLTLPERSDVKRLQQYRANAKKRGKWIDSERKTATSIKDRLKERITVLKAFSDAELKKENRRERLAILRDAVAGRTLEV